MPAAIISEQGIRLAIEDAHFLEMDWSGRGWIFGSIYDGHNGDFASKYSAEHLHQIFLDRLLSGLTPQQAFTVCYETISNALKYQQSGSTSVDFLIRDNKIFTANVGDSRAIVVRRSGFQQLTIDHRVDNAEERTRIRASGASIEYPYVIKGAQGLMPTRTLGDQYFKSVGIIATPSLSEYSIDSDDLMLISACDGLWDFMSNEEVAEFAREILQPEALLETLKREVLISRKGTDNLTILAVSLKS